MATKTKRKAETTLPWTDRVRAILLKLDISQKDLAERTGVTSTCISYIVNGHRQPSRALRKLFEMIEAE